MRKGKVYVSGLERQKICEYDHNAKPSQLVVARNRYDKYLTKPKEVEQYNQYMSGIDKSDQMMYYYSTPKKTIRWYKKVFFPSSRHGYMEFLLCLPKALQE